MKAAFISQNRAEFPIKLLCPLLKLPRSSYYAYLKQSHEPGQREQANGVLGAQIKSLFVKHKQRYGSPRIHKALKQQGIRCSLGGVKRLMRKAGLYALQTRKHAPKQEKVGSLETKNLLLGKAKATGINQVWHSDITQVSTEEGWLYLAGIIDGFSKRMVGYAMAEQMKTELVLQALRSAVLRRKPAKGLIHHSDKGSQ